MRVVACTVVLSLVGTLPAVGLAEKRFIPPPVPDLPPGPPVINNDGAYKAPKADAAVVELLDEGVEALFPVLINDGGGEPGTAVREDRDVFSGVQALRVTPQQKYRSRIPGWNWKIVEKPKNAGEFRYLRFAWKKVSGTGLMIQFHDPAKSWAFRYHAGTNVFGWNPSTQVSAKVPAEWEVVTRDMFKDWGECTISGVAFSPLDGTAGYFDHLLLARSLEDLDKATAAAQGREKPAQALEGKERDDQWAALLGPDPVRAAAALRAFLAGAGDQVEFVSSRLGKLAVEKDLLARIQKLLAELDADEFDRRDRATDELIKLGDAAYEAVKALGDNPPNPEVGYRARLVLRTIRGSGAPVSNAGRLSRVVRVLERADTPQARGVLKKMGDGEYGFDIATDARAALARLARK